MNATNEPGHNKLYALAHSVRARRKRNYFNKRKHIRTVHKIALRTKISVDTHTLDGALCIRLSKY